MKDQKTLQDASRLRKNERMLIKCYFWTLIWFALKISRYGYFWGKINLNKDNILDNIIKLIFCILDIIKVLLCKKMFSCLGKTLLRCSVLKYLKVPFFSWINFSFICRFFSFCYYQLLKFTCISPLHTPSIPPQKNPQIGDKYFDR